MFGEEFRFRHIPNVGLSTRPQVTRASRQRRIQYNRIVSSFGAIAAGEVYSFPSSAVFFVLIQATKKRSQINQERSNCSDGPNDLAQVVTNDPGVIQAYQSWSCAAV
jgi:hypothetical protein